MGSRTSLRFCPGEVVSFAQGLPRGFRACVGRAHGLSLVLRDRNCLRGTIGGRGGEWGRGLGEGYVQFRL